MRSFEDTPIIDLARAAFEEAVLSDERDAALMDAADPDVWDEYHAYIDELLYRADAAMVEYARECKYGFLALLHSRSAKEQTAEELAERAEKLHSVMVGIYGEEYEHGNERQ